MSQVFVLDAQKRPLDPIHPGAARRLLSQRKAAVWRRFPFTVIMKEINVARTVNPLRVKIDPGSQTTGLAVVDDVSGVVVWAAELTHRGEQVKVALQKRRGIRRSRRQRKSRYRQPRWANRRCKRGWLAPSLESRVQNVLTWVARLQRCCPLGAISLELVHFDTQALQQPEIQGVEYQRGELAGFEIKEYLLLKWRHACAYCGATKVPLEIEHLTPKSRGGSNRVSNLALACHDCNQAKGNQTAAEYGFPQLQAQAQAPLRDAAEENTTRWALYGRLQAIGLPLETGTGGRTKWNRTRCGLPKTHWLDATCIGASTPVRLYVEQVIPLLITAMGRQRRQMCLVGKRGFPRSAAKGQRRIHGCETGDLVRAVVPTGERQGTYSGRVAVKANGYFTITSKQGVVPDIAHRYCRLVQRTDGYNYQHGAAASSPTPESAVCPPL